MTLHAKMEALRHWFSRAPVGSDPGTAEAQFWFSVRDVLREWDRPASERAKEWRAEILVVSTHAPGWASDSAQTLVNHQRFHALLEEAERAITHAGAFPVVLDASMPRDEIRVGDARIVNVAAGDQGEVERLRQESADLRAGCVTDQAIEQAAQQAHANARAMKAEAALDEASRTIDKLVGAWISLCRERLMDRLAQKGAG